MVVTATDFGRPARRSEVNVIVTVDKINPPTFLGIPYSRQLEERTANGTSILTVSTSPSTDIVYEIVGEPPAPFLFFVDQAGNIRIKKDLTTDKSMEYKVLNWDWNMDLIRLSLTFPYPTILWREIQISMCLCEFVV